MVISTMLFDYYYIHSTQYLTQLYFSEENISINIRKHGKWENIPVKIIVMSTFLV